MPHEYPSYKTLTESMALDISDEGETGLHYSFTKSKKGFSALQVVTFVTFWRSLNVAILNMLCLFRACFSKHIQMDNEIAFDARSDGQAEIYMMDSDGSNQARLTRLFGANAVPIGHLMVNIGLILQINFYQILIKQEGYEHIFVMKRDGTGQTQLTNSQAHERWPNWHTNGQWIAFTSERDGKGEIYVMNRDGTNQKQVTNHPAEDHGAVWRP